MLSANMLALFFLSCQIIEYQTAPEQASPASRRLQHRLVRGKKAPEQASPHLVGSSTGESPAY